MFGNVFKFFQVHFVKRMFYFLVVSFLVVFAALLLCSVFFLDYYFVIVDIDSLLFYLRTMSLTDNTQATQFSILFIFLISLFVVLLYYFVTIVLLKCRLWVFIFLYLSILYYFNSKHHLWEYLQTFWNHDRDYYAQYYMSPENVSIIFPEKKKNLIVLYLESMENIYSDRSVFGVNLIPSLSVVAEQNLSFSNYHQTIGTYWSMASIVAGSCGVALNLFGHNNNLVSQKYFLKHITCLYDIMHKNGYKMFFMKGGDADFAGLNLFLRNHAQENVQLYDIDYFKAYFDGWKGDDWGAQDSLLYDEAKKKITDLAGQNVPFFATIFTLDTHLWGYLDKQCVRRYGDYRDIIVCADKMASDFIRWFEQQDFSKDTVLIVMGDHLSMVNDIYNQYLLPNEEKRTIYISFIHSQASSQNTTRNFTALDLFPSILESIGVQITQRCLGMGCSIFADKPNLYEQEKAEGLRKKLMQPSSLYRSFIYGK